MKRHNIHHHCFQVSTTERVSSSRNILSKALFPPFGSLWLSKTSRWHFFRYNFDHIYSNLENLYLQKLKTCPQGDSGVVEPGQPGLPGLLAHLTLHADHVGRGVQPVHRHHHLPGWVPTKVRDKTWYIFSRIMLIFMLMPRIKLILQCYNLSSGQSNYGWNLGQCQRRYFQQSFHDIEIGLS